MLCFKVQQKQKLYLHYMYIINTMHSVYAKKNWPNAYVDKGK